MKPPVLHLNPSLYTFTSLPRSNLIPNPIRNSPLSPFLLNSLSFSLKPKPQFSKHLHLIALCSSNPQSTVHGSEPSLANPAEDSLVEQNEQGNQRRVEIRNPVVPPVVSTWVSGFSLGDRVFFLVAFIICTISVAFTSLVVAAVPTLFAMRRAAISLTKLADTTREELPSTMAAIRLSSMEISDLTLELSDLSQEISEGVSKSAQAVQAAEAGIKQLGALAHQQTVSMIQERANLSVISLQPLVSGAAEKTSRAVGTATRTILSIISRGEPDPVRSRDDGDMYEEGDM